MNTHWSHFRWVIWVWLSVRLYVSTFVRSFVFCSVSFSFVCCCARFYFVLVRGGIFWLANRFCFVLRTANGLTFNEEDGEDDSGVHSHKCIAENRIKLDRCDHELDNRLNMFLFFEYVFLLQSKYIYILSPSVCRRHTGTLINCLNIIWLCHTVFFARVVFSLCLIMCQFVLSDCERMMNVTMQFTHMLMGFITVI